MVVAILSPLEMSDAGRMRMLAVGQIVDLPAVVARSLVERGRAMLVSQPPALAAVREMAVTGPEETGQRRRRGGRR